MVGSWVYSGFTYMFGIGAFIPALLCIWAGFHIIRFDAGLSFSFDWIYYGGLYFLLLTLYHALFVDEGKEFTEYMIVENGGVIGALLLSGLRLLFGTLGSFILLLGLIVITVLMIRPWSLSKGVNTVADKTETGIQKTVEKAKHTYEATTEKIRQRKEVYDWQNDLREETKPKKNTREEIQPAPEPIPVQPVSPVFNAAEMPMLKEDKPVVNEIEDRKDEEAEVNWLDSDISVCDEPEEVGAVSFEPAVPEPMAEPETERKEEPQTDSETAAAEAAWLEEIKPIEIEKSEAELNLSSGEAVSIKEPKHHYEVPPITMLNPIKKTEEGVSQEIAENAHILEETLKSFGIEAKILNASRGPAVTRYELEPAAGVKVSKIVNLSDDIALKLAAVDIRMEAPIPGKAAIGIEVPNKIVSPVALREVLDTEQFRNAAGGIPVGLGKDIAGNPVIADLAKMPHLLVAGSTGSGKSVCINTLIASILFKQRPEDVKLILIDPKMVELSNYNGIPHLMTPVVTDAKKAASVLRWAVREMEMRYRKFADTGTKDIARFNKAHPEQAFPLVVIIIDELADLMMVSPADVEDAICRLAQMARAAGLHLVLATQRPSVDVITGTIKANVPSRISFAVSSQIDSRTILDMSGAEKLLGKGDMLFFPMGSSKPKRVQGAFISDQETDDVVEFIKEQAEPEYDEQVQRAQEQSAADEDMPGFEDELLEKAVSLVLEQRQASVSILQRRLRVGYARAARLIDTMEQMKIVGPNVGSRPRDILMTEEQVFSTYFRKEPSE